MMSPRFLPLSLLLLLPLVARAADAPPLSSHVDYTVPGARDLPITCKEGDVQPAAGKTMGQLFGADWPAQPTPDSATAHVPAKVLGWGKIVPPRGLEGQHAVVVMAILVGADGKQLAAEPICLSAAPFAIAAKRALRGARFEAGSINGQPVTSVIAASVVFRLGKSGEGNARSNPGEQD